MKKLTIFSLIFLNLLLGSLFSMENGLPNPEKEEYELEIDNLTIQPEIDRDAIAQHKVLARNLKKDTLWDAADNNKTDTIKFWLNKANYNLRNEGGFTPLLIAVMNKKHNAITYLLSFISFKVDPNLQTNYGWTALHYAVKNQDESALKILIEKGKNLNLNILDNRNLSALHHAIIAKQLNLIKLLINAGADINVKNKNSLTPLLYSATLGEENNEITEWLLQQPKISLNEKDKDGRNCLHIAASQGNIDLIEALLKYNIDKDAQSANKTRTPLHEVIRMHEDSKIQKSDKLLSHNIVLTIIEKLITAGAKSKLKDSKDKTPGYWINQLESTRAKKEQLFAALYSEKK